MQLILMRHGEAERVTRVDAARQLTARGQQQATWMSGHLLERYRPEVFLVSPLLRAQQTLAPFRAALPHVPVHILDSLKPDDDATIAVDDLARFAGACVLVVCHMNIIADMAALLTGDAATSFDLAEARIFEQELILPNLSTPRGQLLPPYFASGA